MAPTTANNSGAKRFELPALNFNFSSLTEGTNIPPPPDSPVEKVPTPPKTPVAAEKKEAAETKPNGAVTAKAANGSSPTNAVAKAEGETQSIATAPSVRPASRSNGSIFDEKKAKRGSGFFRRLRSSDKSGSLYQHTNGSQTTKPEVRGPPPPMIPELSALESKLDVTDGGSLGDDLFQNIK